MLKEFIIGIRVVIVTLVVTGLLYPLVITGVAGVAMPRRSSGSFVKDEEGNVVGSALIGQVFTSPGYFHGRPSAAGTGYDATSSSGSNLGPTSQTLRTRVEKEIAQLKQDNPQAPAQIPADLVTASGSGLDPHISPEGAAWQVSRIAAARKVAPERIQQVVDSYTEGRTFCIFGERRVNVLLLNMAIDRQFGKQG
jgi:K+-transporting ATPase ATPase C chain